MKKIKILVVLLVLCNIVSLGVNVYKNKQISKLENQLFQTNRTQILMNNDLQDTIMDLNEYKTVLNNLQLDVNDLIAK